MDEQKKKILVPEELSHPFFFSQKELDIDQSVEDLNLGEGFIYEILYYNGIDAYKPWLSSNESVSKMLEYWFNMKDDIERLHHDRKHKKIIPSMKSGIMLFLKILFWSNDKPVNLKESSVLDNLEWKPVNIKERLDFILARPGLFHSYVQLSELIIEQQKHFIKKKIITKASSTSEG